MSNCDTIEDVINKLPTEDSEEIKTYDDIVDILLQMGNHEKVFAFADDQKDLRNDVSREFLFSEINSDNNQKYENEIELLLEQANVIIPLYKKI